MQHPTVTASDSTTMHHFIHPDADKADRLYYLVATLACKPVTARMKALVITPNPSLAAINKAVQAEAGSSWYCTEFVIAP